MNITQLRAFLAVADNTNFSATAKELSLTRQSVSRLIRSLEEELHARFFVRKGNQYYLTKEGEAFRGRVQDFMHCCDNLERDIIRISSGKNVPLRLDVDAILTTGFVRTLRNIESQMKIADRDNIFSIKQETSEQAIRNVRNGISDICIVRVDQREFPGLESLVMDVNQLAFLIPSSNPLSHKVHLEETDLNGEFIVFPSDFEFKSMHFFKECASKGISFNADVRINLDPNDFVDGNTFERMAVAFYPRDVDRFNGRPLKPLFLNGTTVPFCDYLIFRRDNPRIKDIHRLCNFIMTTVYNKNPEFLFDLSQDK